MVVFNTEMKDEKYINITWFNSSIISVSLHLNDQTLKNVKIPAYEL